MNPVYPEGLPRGLHSGRKYQLVSPLMRSELASGRARQRRRFTSVPEMVSVSWLFSDVQGRLFESWWRDALVDGSLWFECPLDHPMGYSLYTCRFTDAYSGPSRVGPQLWAYSAELEIRERPALPSNWHLMPSFILHPEIFDFAMNREWPEYLEGPPILTSLNEALQTSDGQLLSAEA